MKRIAVWTLIAALMAGLVFATGCAKKTVPGPDTISAEEQAKLKAEEERRLREARLREQQARQGETSLREMFVNQDIHFNYDSYDLSTEAKQILNEKASYMQSHPQLRIIIEGNCDERGSNSYNMALGEKRALACQAYLEAMGIEGNRMQTVSYGEEKPLVMGTTEEAYSANRRVHFVIQ